MLRAFSPTQYHRPNRICSLLVGTLAGEGVNHARLALEREGLPGGSNMECASFLAVLEDSEAQVTADTGLPLGGDLPGSCNGHSLAPLNWKIGAKQADS